MCTVHHFYLIVYQLLYYNLLVYNIGLNDSGVDSLLLESPYVEGISPLSVLNEISKLEVYPTTPDRELYVIHVHLQLHVHVYVYVYTLYI